MRSINPKAFKCIQWAAVSVLLGRAWQHIVYDAPYRTLLWDERWMTNIVQSLLGLNWETYITSPSVDQAIDGLTTTIGYVLLLIGLIALLFQWLPKWATLFLLLGGAWLLLLAGLYCKEKFFHLGQFLEYTLQWSSPVLLYLWIKEKVDQVQLIRFMKIAILLTFTCHGLYAVGYYPRPHTFMEMTMNILGVSEKGAIYFLNTAGVLDFIISIALFFSLPYSRWATIYAIIWGGLTALARTVAYFHIEFWQESLFQHLPETIYRLPHFLIPLAMYFILDLLPFNK